MTQTKSKVTIFISSTPENLPIARLLREELQNLSPNIETFLSSDDVPKGNVWRDEFLLHLAGSDYLLVIGGEQDSSHSAWQGYEIGYYLGQGNRGRVIAIYDPAFDPPHFVRDLQLAPATQEGLFGSMRHLANEIGSREDAEHINRMKSAAATIAAKFVGGITSQVFQPMMTVSVSAFSRPDNELILLFSIQADSGTLRLLNLPAGNWTLNDIKMHQTDQGWVNETIENVAAVVDGRLPKPSTHLLHKGGDKYLPALYGVERGTGRGLSVTVAFIEWQGEVDAVFNRQHTFFGQPIASKLWPDVFVAMPFADDLEPIYRDHITKVVTTKFGVSLGRADDFYTNHAIMQDVWSAIFSAKVIIADCTGRNPNVFYEIGVSHTLERPTILIAQKSDDIPFDVRHVRAIIYQYTPRGMVDFEKRLEETLHSVMDEHLINKTHESAERGQARS